MLIEPSPLLRVGLGSAGFAARFRFDIVLYQGMPKGISTIALLAALFPADTGAAATAPLLLLFSDAGSTVLHDPIVVSVGLALVAALFREHRAEERWYLSSTLGLLRRLAPWIACGLIFCTIIVVTPRGAGFR